MVPAHTKATVDGAWRRRKQDQRLIVRDKDCRGLALIVNPTGMTWSCAYRPRGNDPLTGRRWPNRTVTIGNPTTHSPDDARLVTPRFSRGRMAAAGPHDEKSRPPPVETPFAGAGGAGGTAWRSCRSRCRLRSHQDRSEYGVRRASLGVGVSGAPFQAADGVFALHRPELYMPLEPPRVSLLLGDEKRANVKSTLEQERAKVRDLTEFIALKRRFGPTGYPARLRFDGPRMLLSDWDLH
jgi:hypothetical protein